MSPRTGRPSDLADRDAEPRLLVWSAPDHIAEAAVRDSLTRLLARCDDESFGLVANAWSQAAASPVRGAVVASRPADALERLAELDRRVPDGTGGRASPGELPVALLLPGEGAERHRMATGLYGAEPVFTGAVDEVLDLFGAAGDAIRDDWCSEEPTVEVHHPQRALPLVFAIDYGLGRVLTSWGVRPAVIVGQGIGEWVGAVLGSVLELPVAVALVDGLARCLADAPDAGALAVAAEHRAVAEHLAPDVTLAADNRAGQIVVSGPAAAITSTEAALGRAGISCMRLRGRVAYRSAAAEPATAGALETLRRARLHPSQVPLLSSTAATAVSPVDAVDPAFWAGQASRPVLLRDTLDVLFESGPYCCVHAGPGQGLAALVARHPAVASGEGTVTAMLRDRPAAGGADDLRSLLCAAARLWTADQELDPSAVARRALPVG